MIKFPAFDRIKLRIIFASAAATLLTGATMLNSFLDGRQRIMDSASRDLSAYSQSTAISMSEALNLVDFTLKRARQEWLETGKLRPHAEFIGDFPNFRELIIQVAVIGTDGYLIASSLPSPMPNVYLGEREHFRIHANSASDKIFVSKPVVGKVSGRKTIQFTRPIFDEKRSFAGVIVVSANPDYISSNAFAPIASAEMVAILNGSDNVPRVVSSNIRNLGGDGGTASSSTEPINNKDQFLWTKVASESVGLVLEIGYPQSRIRSRIYSAAWKAASAFLVVIALIAWYTHSIFRLVNARNKLLIKLEDSNKKANSANSMKSRFVAGISHELRTPLNSILGFAELVEMSGSHSEAKQYGAIISAGASHLHHLVNTLLDLAKIEAGQMTTVYTDSDLWPLFESVVELHRIEADKKGLPICLNIEASSPTCIHTDRIKLMQVLNNLLSNAVKFTEEGAIFVNVALVCDRWSISIVDTGIGMSKEQLSGVFDRFNNIKYESEAASGKEGAGLGMALCKELVELLGGRIDIQSEINAGTTVKISLPHTPAGAVNQSLPQPA